VRSEGLSNQYKTERESEKFAKFIAETQAYPGRMFDSSPGWDAYTKSYEIQTPSVIWYGVGPEGQVFSGSNLLALTSSAGN
jgi:hypothetical protein